MKEELLISDEKVKEIVKLLSNNFTLKVLEIIFKEKRNQFFPLKVKIKDEDNIRIEVRAFVKALTIIVDEQTLLIKKNKSMDLTKIERAAQIRASQYQYQSKKNHEKWAFLLNHKNVVMRMKSAENLSTRQVAEQLVKRKYIKYNTFKKSNKQSISHTYLQKFIDCMEKTDV